MGFTIVPLVRLAALSTITAFSIIVLGLAGHTESATQGFDGVIVSGNFVIAIAILTLVSLPVFLIFSLVRKQGAVANYVLVELICLTLLWIFWMSSAGYTSATVSVMSAFCSNPAFQQVNGEYANCNELRALAAFSWLTWIILLVYTKGILVLAIIQHNRGNRNVWTKCVHEVNFFAPPPGGKTEPGVSSPQPTGQQPSPQQVPEYSAGTPPVQQETPMNTGYAQPPADPEKAEMSQTAGIQPTELFRAYRTAGKVLRTADHVTTKVTGLNPGS